MGLVWIDKNAGHRLPAHRPVSARLVTGRDLSADLLLGHRGTRQVEVTALLDLPAIEQRRRYLAALGRINNRIRQT